LYVLPRKYAPYLLYRAYHVCVRYEIPVTQARAEFADLVNRVVYGGERVVLTRHGKPIVALVAAADLDRLEEDEQRQPATVIRLSTDTHGRAIAADPPTRQQFDIAAERRLPGGDAEPPRR
jgi:prevent-host-death family protein